MDYVRPDQHPLVAYGTATIAAAASESEAIDTRGYRLGSFQTPAALTGSNVTIEMSNDGTNWTAAAAAIAVAVDNTYVISVDAFSAKWLRFKSDGVEAAARSISYVFKR